MNLRKQIVAQFRQPHGRLGELAGWVMSNRASNVQRNRWTVDLLNVQPNDRILEIGCGPGIAAEACLQRLETGKYTGIDHSPVMLQQTARRNARGAHNGRLELHCGNLALLDSMAGGFDKVFSVNVAQFFDDKSQAFKSIKHIMRGGGLLATTHQPRNSNPTRRDAEQSANLFADTLADAGFADIEIKKLMLRDVPAMCVLATKPINESMEEKTK